MSSKTIHCRVFASADNSAETIETAAQRRPANMPALCETVPTSPRETSIQVPMTPTPSPSAVPSEFNDFLYSPIGEDKNGLLVTVLSALARQDVDPWQEAADLDGLPRDTAVQKLTSIIATLPGHQPMLDDPTPIAVRLIALLPRRAASLNRRSTPRICSRQPT